MSFFLYDDSSRESYILTRIVSLLRFETLRDILTAWISRESSFVLIGVTICFNWCFTPMHIPPDLLFFLSELYHLYPGILMHFIVSCRQNICAWAMVFMKVSSVSFEPSVLSELSWIFHDNTLSLPIWLAVGDTLVILFIIFAATKAAKIMNKITRVSPTANQIGKLSVLSWNYVLTITVWLWVHNLSIWCLTRTKVLVGLESPLSDYI